MKPAYYVDSALCDCEDSCWLHVLAELRIYLLQAPACGEDEDHDLHRALKDVPPCVDREYWIEHYFECFEFGESMLGADAEGVQGLTRPPLFTPPHTSYSSQLTSLATCLQRSGPLIPTQKCGQHETLRAVG